MCQMRGNKGSTFLLASLTMHNERKMRKEREKKRREEVLNHAHMQLHIRPCAPSLVVRNTHHVSARGDASRHSIAHARRSHAVAKPLESRGVLGFACNYYTALVHAFHTCTPHLLLTQHTSCTRIRTRTCTHVSHPSFVFVCTS